MEIIADVAVIFALLLLMTYELTGQAAHEWIGISMLLLLVLHHFLNSKWSKNTMKSRYTMPQIMQTVLIVLSLLAVINF